jgi:hypothetical protein
MRRIPNHLDEKIIENILDVGEDNYGEIQQDRKKLDIV